MRQARGHLNFSTWSEYPPKKQHHKLEELIEMIEHDEMPLWYYRPLHPDAQLSDAERRQLIAWAEAERRR